MTPLAGAMIVRLLVQFLDDCISTPLQSRISSYKIYWGIPPRFSWHNREQAKEKLTNGGWSTAVQSSQLCDIIVRRQSPIAMASISPPRRTSTTRDRVRPPRLDYIAHTNHSSQGFCRKSRDGNRNRTWTDLPTAPIRGQLGLMPASQRATHCRNSSG